MCNIYYVYIKYTSKQNLVLMCLGGVQKKCSYVINIVHFLSTELQSNIVVSAKFPY
jgi:hypothetical protein